MNTVTDIVFTSTWLLLFLWAISSIVRGWRFAPENASRPSGMWTTKVTRRIHPEMIDVQPGEELMGVTFDSPSCDLEEYKALQERIAELKNELEDPWEEDDDDDDGDIIVRV